MIKRFGIVLLLAVTLTFNGYSQLGRGGLLEKRDTSLILKRNFPRNTFNFPASYSLKKWAPPVLSQGNLSSCTAWSSAYAGFTIIRRMEENDPSLEPFSAINLYNRLKAEDSQDPCYAGGCYVSDACEMLEDHGCAKFKEVDNSCGYTSASKNYKDKLYNHDELNVSEHDIKSALVKNSPVVIVIPFYNDGWDKKENLKNGVWNGQASGEDGYHAMCIIGYDDNVGGGAFHVMNSWGDDWAQNGFFWLRYKDIEHINQAVMLVGDPNKLKDFKNNNTDNTDYTTDNTNNNNTDNNNTDNTDNSNNNDQYDHWDEGHNQVFRLYNECTVPAYLAIAMFVDGEWVSRGWYATQPDDYVEIPIGNRGADNIFWMAVNNANDLMWDDDANGTDMCYNPTDAFTIYNNKDPECPKHTKFFSASPGYEEPIYTQTITCPNFHVGINNNDGVNNNNTTNVLTTNFTDGKTDNRETDVANYNWSPGYILFDLYSDEIIHPEIEDGVKMYNIWFIGRNDAIRQRTFTETELSELRAYKFSSEYNAQRWLDSKK